MTLTAGTRLGPYEILEPLGAGGMGEVYRARDTRLGREVALKVLPAELAENRDRLARFEQEARSASALNHPNIVTIHDIGKADSLSYIAMELVQGRSLREIVSSGPLPPRRLLGVAVQAAEGLAKAHAAGIVHRDLKPENLIVSADGFVKILDFGLAKLVPPVSGDLSTAPTMGESTKPGIVMGTVGYMSPEQAAGKAVDFRSDQFSLGAILYEMATGVRPFQRETVVETLSAILRVDPEPLTARTPEAPPPLSWIVERCLAKEPADRYASTQDLARELRGLSEHLSEIVRSGESSALPARALPVGRSRRAFLTGAAIGLAAGIAATLFWPRQEAPAAAPFVRYLTYSGRDYGPAASPDGRMVAFASDRDGRSRIWLKQLAGGSEAPLTEGPDDSPRFSPDGSMLLYARTEAKSSSIYRATVVGGETRRILDDASQADWSPDGKRIAFLRNLVEASKQVSIVGVANPEGGDRREIARIENHVLNNPRWSPDGGSVAFTEVGQSGSIRTVFLVDARTGRVRQIQPMAPATLAAGPAWCPDGRSILYSLGESVAATVTGGNARIIRHDVVSGQAKTLFWSPGANDVLDLLPDGRLVMEAGSGRENLKEMVLEGQAPPRDVRRLTRGNTADRQPTFSPDGEWIVFSSNRSGNLDLWEISTRTAAIRRLTDDTADDWDPGFTREGKLIWSSSRSGALEIWIAEGDGSGARQLTRDGVDAENPTATPDGWIVYSQGDPAKQGIWKVRPDGSGRTLVVPGTILFPEVSPDGRYVAYASIIGRGGEVRVARLEDGRTTPFRIPIQTALSAEVGAVGRSKWMPDGKTIIFFEHEEGQPYCLYAQSFDPARDTSATRRRLTGFDPDVWFESFGISPDGSRIVVGAYERLSNLLIADRVPELSPRGARSR